jgi:hypothetical protein
MAEGKVQPGDDFNPPPAAIWNNMVDAGRAWADGRFSKPAPNPTRPRETDIIRIKNTSGEARRRGEILKIDGKAIETVTDEAIWLVGVEPTEACYFGIVKKPVQDDGLEQLQVSGCCLALVDVTDIDHTRANVVEGEYVLTSSDSGPLEILYQPGEEGEQECVVRFAGGAGGKLVVILDAALPAASHSLTGATSCLATVCRWDSDAGEYAETDRQVTVYNHSEVTSHEDDTFGYAEVIDGHLHFFGDCEPMISREPPE